MESRFWQYFHNKLSWPGIFAPGPLSAVVKGLALYLDDVREDILWLRRQFTPATADDDLIERYGASRGVPRTKYDTNETYRIRVVRAYAWHKLGGLIHGLPQVLAEYGYPGGVIRHCRDDDPALWAHFEVHLLTPSHEWGQADIDAVYALANTYKPARSVIKHVTFALRQEAPVFAGASQTVAVVMDHAVQNGHAAFPPSPLEVGAASTMFIQFAVEVNV